MINLNLITYTLHDRWPPLARDIAVNQTVLLIAGHPIFILACVIHPGTIRSVSGVGKEARPHCQGWTLYFYNKWIDEYTSPCTGIT